MSETETKESPPTADFATLNDERTAKMYSEEQFKGLLADKQAEVKKRQDAEKQIAELQSQLSESKPAEETGDRWHPFCRRSLCGEAKGMVRTTATQHQTTPSSTQKQAISKDISD